MGWTLTQNCHDIVFLNFLIIYFFLIVWLQCLSYHIWTDHVDTNSSLSTTVFIMSIVFFLLIWLYLQELPYWEMCTDHINNASTLSKRVYNMSILCLLILFDLLMIFASVTILGNAHRPCKQYPNIVDNSLHHVYSFFPEFSWFSCYLSINCHIWKCAHSM